MKTQHTKAEYTLKKPQVQNIINSTINFRDRCILKCLYFAGMRVSEVVNLKIENIRFDTKVIDILESKGGKTRSIPVLDNNFLSDLKHLIGKRSSGVVFRSNEKSLSRRMIQYICQNAGVKANIKPPDPIARHINAHLFRHSIARHLKADKYPLEFIQKFLGHSSMMTTADVYGTIGLEEMQEMVARKTGDRTLIGGVISHVPEISYED